MKDINAHQLLAKVMAWKDEDPVRDAVPRLQLLADYKYDQYQQFGPGQRFFESLALWLRQFNEPSERETALAFVLNDLVFLSDKELSHLVRLAYRDVIVQERLKLVAQEQDIPMYRVKRIVGHPRFADLEKKSLYLGLSDGARTNELRRASELRIKNDQIWQAYELSDAKVLDMLQALREDLAPANTSEVDALSEIEVALSKGDRDGATKILDRKLSESKKQPPHLNSKFNIVWLIDDFSGSGNTYIRYDPEAKVFKGKIKKIYSQLQVGDLVDTSHYEVYLLLYVATRQAIDHIEYWAERFTSEHGYKPLHLRVLYPIEKDISLTARISAELKALIAHENYYDNSASDKHIRVGGTADARLGFANCALPLVLPHNTPNNSIYLLWGPKRPKFFGLFPRVSRHREQ